MPHDISQECTCVQVRDLHEGDIFKLAPTDIATVWIRGEYIRGEKKYECYKYDDMNHFTYLKSNRYVYTGFTF